MKKIALVLLLVLATGGRQAQAMMRMPQTTMMQTQEQEHTQFLLSLFQVNNRCWSFLYKIFVQKSKRLAIQQEEQLIAQRICAEQMLQNIAYSQMSSHQRMVQCRAQSSGSSSSPPEPTSWLFAAIGLANIIDGATLERSKTKNCIEKLASTDFSDLKVSKNKKASRMIHSLLSKGFGQFLGPLYAVFTQSNYRWALPQLIAQAASSAYVHATRNALTLSDADKQKLVAYNTHMTSEQKAALQKDIASMKMAAKLQVALRVLQGVSYMASNKATDWVARPTYKWQTRSVAFFTVLYAAVSAYLRYAQKKVIDKALAGNKQKEAIR